MSGRHTLMDQKLLSVAILALIKGLNLDISTILSQDLLHSIQRTENSVLEEPGTPIPSSLDQLEDVVTAIMERTDHWSDERISSVPEPKNSDEENKIPNQSDNLLPTPEAIFLNLTETPHTLSKGQEKTDLTVIICPDNGDFFRTLPDYFPQLCQLIVIFQLKPEDTGKLYPIPLSYLNKIKTLKSLTLQNVRQKAISFTGYKTEQTANEPFIYEKDDYLEEIRTLKIVDFDETLTPEEEGFLFGSYKIKTLHLEKGNLRHNFFPGYKFLYKIKELTLIDFPIKNKLNSIMFQQFSTLQVLIVNGCNFKYIDISRIYRLRFLKKLDLKRNLLERLPKEIFHNLHNLQYLDVSENKLNRLANLQDHLKIQKLEILICRSNQIDLIGKRIFNLPNLKHIDARETRYPT